MRGRHHRDAGAPPPDARRCAPRAELNCALQVKGSARLEALAPALSLSPGAVSLKLAWVGDSRAALSRYEGSRPSSAALTRDHKASDPFELARVTAFYEELRRRGSSFRGEGSGTGSVTPHGGSTHSSSAALAAMSEEPLRLHVVSESMFAELKAPPGTPPAGSCHPAEAMETEVAAAFAGLEEFDPKSLALNIGTNAKGELIVTVPPRKGSAGSPRARGEESGRGGRGEGSGRGISRPNSAGSTENSRHGPSGLLEAGGMLRRSATPPTATGAPGGAEAGRVLGRSSTAPHAEPDGEAAHALRRSSTAPHVAGAPGGGDAQVRPCASAPGLANPSGSLLTPEALAAVKREAMAAQLRDRRSFVARLYDPATGEQSNLRLFGGSVGASTAMTRSIGDRGAARCCTAEPEVATVMVGPGLRARLLVASDGLWDVLTVEQAEQLGRPGRGPEGAALTLVTRAKEDRGMGACGQGVCWCRLTWPRRRAGGRRHLRHCAGHPRRAESCRRQPRRRGGRLLRPPMSPHSRTRRSPRKGPSHHTCKFAGREARVALATQCSGAHLWGVSPACAWVGAPRWGGVGRWALNCV